MAKGEALHGAACCRMTWLVFLVTVSLSSFSKQVRFFSSKVKIPYYLRVSTLKWEFLFIYLHVTGLISIKAFWFLSSD